MYSENVSESQVTQVGMDFIPGPETNSEIHSLLTDGYSTPAPDFCSNLEVSLSRLNELEVWIGIFPAVKSKSQEWVGIFETVDGMYATVPFKTKAHVAACVLWFSLFLIEKHKSQVT